MGLWRKYALFLYIAALQSADNESYGVAHALVSSFFFVFVLDFRSVDVFCVLLHHCGLPVVWKKMIGYLSHISHRIHTINCLLLLSYFLFCCCIHLIDSLCLL